MNGFEIDLNWYFAAVFALAKKLAPRTHRPSLGVTKVTFPKAHIVRSESFGNKHLDGLANEFVALIAKEGLSPFVDKDHPPFFVSHDHRGRRRIDH